jgi:C-terminal processing protease CtpA/Prc
MVVEKFCPLSISMRARAWSMQLAALALLCFLSAGAMAQSVSLDRDRSRTMLNTIKDEIKKNYYDPNYHGLDLETHFKAVDEKLKQANNLDQMFSLIGQALMDFEDSHTVFFPPQRTGRTDYGWKMQLIGDEVYVTAVKPKSDAEKKGLKPGDRIAALGGYKLTRDSLRKLLYIYYVLRPQPGMRLMVQVPNEAEPRQVDVVAKIEHGKQVLDLSETGDTDIGDFIREIEEDYRLSRHRYSKVGDDLFIWKMSGFYSKEDVDNMMSKVDKSKALILDLRGNGGGAVEALQQLIGRVFEKDITVGEVKTRKEAKPLIAKTRSHKVFAGKLIVLVDSESGSASEIFARVVQMHGRGVVIGDRTAGAVMRSRSHGFAMGGDTQIFYRASITNADIVMTDGKSLERIGVTPDELKLPTGADMAANRDPVLSYAASLVGVKLEPEKAGALFPREWKKQ